MKLHLQKKLGVRNGKVKSVDFHPNFSWILLGLYDGALIIYDYNTQQSIQYVEVTNNFLRTAKFMPEKNFIICGSDDKMIRVYNYNTMEKVHEFEAHTDFIRSIVVHYKEPLFLTSSDDGTINLYDASNNFSLVRSYTEHEDFVMRLAVNPKDYNMFASASMDKKVKIWSFNSPNSQLTLEGHTKGVGALAFCPLNDKPYLASGGDDHIIKIWDYTNKQCIYTLEGHDDNLSSLCFHPELPILISGAEDFTCKFWNINTSKIEDSKIFGYDCIWDIAVNQNDNLIGYACDEGVLVVQTANEPLFTFSSNHAKIIYMQQNTILSLNLKQIQQEYKDGEIINLPPKEIGVTDMYPEKISYSPSGKYFSLFGGKEFIISTTGIYRSSAVGPCSGISWNDGDSFVVKDGTYVKLFKESKEVSKFKPSYSFDAVFGGPLFAVKSEDAVYFYFIESDNFIFIRKIDVAPNKIIWNSKKSLVALITDDCTFILKVDFEKIENFVDNMTEGNIKGEENECEEGFEIFYDINEQISYGFFIDDIFIYQTIKNKINYSINDKTFNITTLPSKFFLLGYLPATNHIYLMNKNNNLISYTLPMSYLNYQIAIINKDFNKAEELLKDIPDDFIEKLTTFLEKFNYNELCFNIAKDPNKKFSLALKLKKLEECWKLAEKDGNEEKFKFVADLAMELGEFSKAEKAMYSAKDYPGLLLYFSSIQDRNKLKQLADVAKENGVFNIAYTCYYQINELDSCFNLLMEAKRFPEAALFCRTYYPKKLPEAIEKWNEILSEDNAESRVETKIVNPITEDNAEIFKEIEEYNQKYYDNVRNGSFDDIPNYVKYLNMDLMGAISNGRKEEIDNLINNK